jgi:hypothetical protein
VELGVLHNGLREILKSKTGGLSKTDRVIVSNLQLVRQGSPVVPHEGKMTVGEAPSPAPAKPKTEADTPAAAAPAKPKTGTSSPAAPAPATPQAP